MIIKNVEIVQPLEDVLSQLRAELHMKGIKLLEKEPRESGHNIQCQCIYHGNGQERKPSFGLDKRTGVGHCFACDATVGLDEFISNCFGYNDSGAYGWSWLIQNFVTLEKGENRVVKLKISTNRNSVADINSSIEVVSEEELDSYRYYHPYWEKRGITDNDLIEFFDLGYDKNSKSITMPVRDIDGNCLFVARRSIYTKFFSYPSGSTKPLYGLYELYQYPEFPKEVWITESIIDCLRLWQNGKFAVALNGLGTTLQYRQINEMPCISVVLATDMDEAGQKARVKLRNKIRGKLIYEVFLPEGRKDIGECTDEEIISLVPSIL